MMDDVDLPARPRATRPPATKKGRRSAEAFRAAASQVFAEHGFLNATVADIAEAAGRSPAAFYYHYDSKEDVLLELFEDFKRTISRRANATLQTTRSRRAHIEQLTRNFYMTYREWLPVLTGVFQLSMVDANFHERWRDIRRDAVHSIRRWVIDAQQQGRAAGLDVDLAASALAAMLDGFCYMWLARDGDLPAVELDDERAQRTLATICYVSLYGAVDDPIQP